MIKKIVLFLVSMCMGPASTTFLYATQQSPQEKNSQPQNYKLAASSIFSKMRSALRSTFSWTVKDTYTTPRLIDEIAPYRKSVSDVSEIIALLEKLKAVVSEDKNLDDFIIDAVVKKEDPNKEHAQKNCSEIIQRTINQADVVIFYLVGCSHLLSDDAQLLAKTLLPVQPQEENKEEIESISLTQEYIQSKILLLETYKQKQLIEIGTITLKYKNLPIIKPIATFIANKCILIPLKLSLLIVGTALLIQLGGLGISYAIPSLREFFPSLTRFDFCFTPLYALGSLIKSSIGTLRYLCPTTQTEGKEIIKIVEKPVELYKECEEFVTKNVNLSGFEEVDKIKYIKKCIMERASSDTEKILRLFGIQK